LNENLKVFLKIAIYVGLPVFMITALIWMRTFHWDMAWVRIAWKGVWLVGLPIMILIGGYIVMRANTVSNDTDKPE